MTCTSLSLLTHGVSPLRVITDLALVDGGGQLSICCKNLKHNNTTIVDPYSPSNFTTFFCTDAINTYSFLLLCIEELEVPMTIFIIRS